MKESTFTLGQFRCQKDCVSRHKMHKWKTVALHLANFGNKQVKDLSCFRGILRHKMHKWKTVPLHSANFGAKKMAFSRHKMHKWKTLPLHWANFGNEQVNDLSCFQDIKMHKGTSERLYLYTRPILEMNK